MRIGDTEVPDQAVMALCRKWKIRRLEVFGSALTRMTPGSDIDLLVDFESGERWSLMDLAGAEVEFGYLLGRRVELVDRRSLERSENTLRRDAILNSSEVLYAA
jgi:uncharacterized protein